MATAPETIREKVRDLAEHLPTNATWDDVIEKARFLKAVEIGIAAADRGEFASEEAVKAAFKKWGVNVES
jgi:predicted transcriptional regulator